MEILQSITIFSQYCNAFQVLQSFFMHSKMLSYFFLLIFKGFRIIFTNSSDIILQGREYGKVSQYFLNIVILSKYYNLIYAQQAALLLL